MTEEEAIGVLDKYLNENERKYVSRKRFEFLQAIETVLNLVKKQQEEIEYYKKQKNYDDQFKHELLEQIRCKSLEIDSLNKVLDDRLIYIQGGRGLYAKLRGLDKEYLIREYLLMYKMCKAEIKKKDKIIDEMANTIYDYASLEVVINCPAEYDGKYNMDLCKMNLADRNCLVCIKQYFENKVEGSK